MTCPGLLIASHDMSSGVGRHLVVQGFECGDGREAHRVHLWAHTTNRADSAPQHLTGVRS